MLCQLSYRGDSMDLQTQPIELVVHSGIELQAAAQQIPALMAAQARRATRRNRNTAQAHVLLHSMCALTASLVHNASLPL